ncbi:MAG TPA: GNAT family N-acetyltransferase [Polyangiaceae bacterium]|nr:GNAT family N-acetyltransferase [Polyangiaceae bacterium]
MTHELRAELARAEDIPEIEQLFRAADVPCYCQYWHFTGDKNAWFARCAFEADQNLRELEQRLRTPESSPQAVLARGPDGVVGWMKLCRAADVPKLFEQRVYRSLRCFTGDRDRTWVVGCFLIHPDWRRCGVADKLLERGIEIARQMRAHGIEALPRRGEGLSEPEMCAGPYDLFVKHGFRIVDESYLPYPVLRIDLAVSDATPEP